ncbi:MAG: hypothetical protein GX962_15975, partial [Epulopiscium sp.]|nr:hypothetical protein [Candidatus Epulonipiscium sp.]
EETMDLVQRTKYYLEYMDDEEALAKLEDVVYWRDLELEAATGTSKENWRKWNTDGGKIDYQLTEEGIEIYNLGEGLGGIYTRNFTLKPSTEYQLIVKLLGQDMKTDMEVAVTSISGTSTQMRENIFLKDDQVEIYVINFTTTSDIQQEGQRIVFNHPGGTKGCCITKYIMLKKVKDEKK